MMTDPLVFHVIYGAASGALFIYYLYFRGGEPQKKNLIFGLGLLAAAIVVEWWYADSLVKLRLDYLSQAYYVYVNDVLELIVMIGLGLVFIILMYVDSLIRIRRFLR